MSNYPNLQPREQQTKRMTSPPKVKVNANRFYEEYHGHLVPHLEALLPSLRSSSEAMIWTAGDSSLGTLGYSYIWFF